MMEHHIFGQLRRKVAGNVGAYLCNVLNFDRDDFMVIVSFVTVMARRYG